MREVLEATREHIFDGLVIDTPAGQRFVDAPEVARIAERRVTLTLDAEGAAALPEHDSQGAPDVPRERPRRAPAAASSEAAGSATDGPQRKSSRD